MGYTLGKAPATENKISAFVEFILAHIVHFPASVMFLFFFATEKNLLCTCAIFLSHPSVGGRLD